MSLGHVLDPYKKQPLWGWECVGFSEAVEAFPAAHVCPNRDTAKAHRASRVNSMGSGLCPVLGLVAFYLQYL